MSSTPETVETANANLAQVTAELRAAIARVGTLIRSGRTDAGEYRLREGVTHAELDAATADRDRLRHAEKAAQTRLERALAAAAPARLTSAQAAAEALRQHEIAVEALRTAEAALRERDAAYITAGSPAKAWQTRTDLGARLEDGGGALTVTQINRARIEGFDVRAVQSVANGEDVPSFVKTARAEGDRQDFAADAGPQW